jgi:hypothetical protein
MISRWPHIVVATLCCLVAVRLGSVCRVRLGAVVRGKCDRKLPPS